MVGKWVSPCELPQERVNNYEIGLLKCVIVFRAEFCWFVRDWWVRVLFLPGTSSRVHELREECLLPSGQSLQARHWWKEYSCTKLGNLFESQTELLRSRRVSILLQRNSWVEMLKRVQLTMKWLKLVSNSYILWVQKPCTVFQATTRSFMLYSQRVVLDLLAQLYVFLHSTQFKTPLRANLKNKRVPAMLGSRYWTKRFPSHVQENVPAILRHYQVNII